MSGIVPSVLQDWQSKREMLQSLRDAYRDKAHWVVARAQFKDLGSEEGVAFCDDTLKMFDEFIAETKRVLAQTGGGGLVALRPTRTAL